MPKCAYCGKDAQFPFKCKFCGGYFCSEHRLPENHNCGGLEEYKEKAKKELNVVYEPFRHRTTGRSRKMKKPIQDYLPKSATNFLLFIIIIASIIGFYRQGFFLTFDLDPTKAFAQLWRLVTSIFLHGNFLHLFVNAFVLFFFGHELERRVGKRKFLEIFFVSGIIASLGYAVFALFTNPIPAIGASGAIYGILGSLVFLAPEIRVFILFIPIPMKLIYAIILFIVWDFVLRLKGVPIANTAHLAGLITGLAYGYFLRKKLAIYGRLNPF